jgi:hypothetical protein
MLVSFIKPLWHYVSVDNFIYYVDNIRGNNLELS